MSELDPVAGNEEIYEGSLGEAEPEAMSVPIRPTQRWVIEAWQKAAQQSAKELNSTELEDHIIRSIN